MSQTLKLSEFESRDILTLTTRGPGIYDQNLSIIGNGILSTVYVESITPGTSISVEYFDRTTGIDTGENVLIASHPLILSAGSSKTIVIGFHDKPLVRTTVLGGVARFGLYGTVKNFSEVDKSLSKADQHIDILQSKGLLIGGFDQAENKFQLLPIQNDSVKISSGSDGLSVYPNGLRNGGRITQVTLNETTWTALPLTPLAHRNALAIQNFSGKNIAINYSDQILNFTGIIIPDLAERSYNITETIVLYGKSQKGSAVVTVEELS